MNSITISSFPRMVLAHSFRASCYRTNFTPRESYLEVAYVNKGSLTVTLGEKTYIANKGDVLCLLCNESFRVSASDFHEHHTVGAIVQWKFCPEEEPDGLYLPMITSASCQTGTVCQLIDELIHRLDRYKSSSIKFAAKYLEILCEIDRCNRRFLEKRLPSEQRYAHKAKAYILKNIQKPITQAEVAAHLGITPGYLCSLFKETEGITLMKYINKTKLDGMKALMDSTGLRLYEAAELYGYSDPNYVSRLFKQLFGYNITAKPQRIQPK